MKRWRAVLRIDSALATPLSAERLFGHICWGIAWREGSEAVANFLEKMRSGIPPIVLGEPMPIGFVPMPAILRTGQFELDLIGRRRAIWQLYRRLGMLPRTGLFGAAADLRADCIRESLEASGWPKPILPDRQLRVRSRTSRLSSSPTGAGERLAVEVWPRQPDGQVEMPIVSDLEATELSELLQKGLENGYGRGASAGFGQVELVGLSEAEDWPEPAEVNAVITLGPCVPKRTDPSRGWWEVQVKRGKLGGGYAVQAEIAAGALEKRPVITLRAGAVFLGQSGPFVGRLVEAVHPQRPEVVHYGLAPTLPVRLEAEAD